MTAPAQMRKLSAFRLVTADPDRLRHFYVEGLGCEAGARTAISPNEIRLLALSGGGVRTRLSLGNQTIELDCFDAPGEPYPSDTNAAALDFQHFAIVTTDAKAAYRRALAYGATAISAGEPVKLPTAAGGVIAVKFRDPEGHPLEFLQFPQGPSWTRMGASDLLGVDHSAISVGDLAASLEFYTAHGLSEGKGTLNHGETQAALDGLPAPQVDVAPLKPSEPGPHLELLHYRSPKGRPAAAARANDVQATRLVWASDRDAFLLDCDGHRHQLQLKA